MSHPSLENLGPPPRRVPLPVRCHLCFGGVLSIVGWAVFFGSMFFVWFVAFDSAAVDWLIFRGQLSTCNGVVTGGSRTRASEGGSKTRKGTPVYVNHYSYTLQDGATRQGSSYATGRQLSAQTPVTIEYVPGKPERSRIQGMRSRTFSAGAAFVVIFPLIGLCLTVPGFLFAGKARRLLEQGVLGTGKLKEKKPTGARVNKKPVYKLTFQFMADNGRAHEVSASTHLPEKLEDEREEKVIYDPVNPARAVLVDGLPGTFRVDGAGNIESDNPRGALLVTLLPVLSVAVHGGYALTQISLVL